jgi:ATPase family protein associated with various cellular activities (AAA)
MPTKKTAKKAAKKTKTRKPKKGTALAHLPMLSAAEKKAYAESVKNEAIKKLRMQSLKTLSFQELGDAIIGCSQDFYYVLNELFARNPMTLKMQMGQRWYPVRLTSHQCYKTFSGMTAALQINVRVFDTDWTKYPTIYDSDFADALGNRSPRKFHEVLSECGLALTTPEEMAEHHQLIDKTSKFRNAIGQTMDIVSSVLQPNDFFFGPRLIERPLGTPNGPRVGIIEPELELGNDDYRNEEDDSNITMPFLRVFSLDLKRYVFVDVRDIRPHEFQENAIEKLVLPTDLKDVITSVFNANEVFGDLFAGRHGGMVVLANGNPGCGKTLTAEVFAEQTKRPLYILEMGELGVQLAEVEKSLQLIFTRAARWNTVLLFDEADIFLSKRTDNDLERNAIVGVFLRLLDNYRGMLFLTTNRADAIDSAFASRITLRLDYPDLTPATRQTIWTHMFNAAGFSGLSDWAMQDLSNHTLNGRQIRNMVRLLRAVHPSENILSLDTVKKYLKYAPATMNTASKSLTGKVADYLGKVSN